MEHLVDVFYVKRKLSEDKFEEIAKFFERTHAEDNVSRIEGQPTFKDKLSIEKRTEKMIQQHPAHRPG